MRLIEILNFENFAHFTRKIYQFLQKLQSKDKGEREKTGREIKRSGRERERKMRKRRRKGREKKRVVGKREIEKG